MNTDRDDCRVLEPGPRFCAYRKTALGFPNGVLCGSHQAGPSTTTRCGAAATLRFPQIATGDLNIAVVDQLPPPNLPFCDQFEPCPVEMVGFEAASRRRCLCKQYLENASGHAHHTLIFADIYAEFDARAVRVTTGPSGGKLKNMILL